MGESVGEAGVTAEGTVGVFRASMPGTYARVYAEDEVAEHAAIVARRALQPAHVELWRKLPGGSAVLCVVADDHPGFLSMVSAVLYLHELDVATAQIYCRARADGVGEAVDFFWVRPLRHGTHPHAEREVASIKRILGELVVRQACPDPIAPRRGVLDRETVPLARVFFETAPLRSGSYVLVVEALDFPGLLMSIARALHRQNLDVLASDVRTEGTRVHDRFVIADALGEPLTPDRLAAIRAAVVVALRAGMGGS
jgi:UTP:GlnB (protein PII) uridylyltransferase